MQQNIVAKNDAIGGMIRMANLDDLSTNNKINTYKYR